MRKVRIHPVEGQPELTPLLYATLLKVQQLIHSSERKSARQMQPGVKPVMAQVVTGVG